MVFTNASTYMCGFIHSYWFSHSYCFSHPHMFRNTVQYTLYSSHFGTYNNIGKYIYAAFAL